jgi:hypothetical protein
LATLFWVTFFLAAFFTAAGLRALAGAADFFAAAAFFFGADIVVNLTVEAVSTPRS